jgi:hypothetical protein
VGEESVLTVPGFGGPASLSSSPFEALDVDVFDSGFESEGFESAEEALESD